MTSEYFAFNEAPDSTKSSSAQRGGDQGFNPEDYKEALGVNTLSDDEIELLRALWYIMSVFVDIGWGVDTVQIVLPEIFGEAAPPETGTSEKGKGHD